jgi:cellulose synthase/poly-beta-1,6-N-acetylglucosamine synthase-like glycosyltransferase
MKDIEIPFQHEKTKTYRNFERLPAVLSWSVLALPFVLSVVSPRATVFFILAYLLMWFMRAVALNVRALQGFKTMKQHERLPWDRLIADVENGRLDYADAPNWHAKNISRMILNPGKVKPSEVIHAVMVATYNESRDILEPTIQAVLDSNYDKKKIILVLAYEERGGPQVEEQAKALIDEYGDNFLMAEAVKHPKDLPGEVIGKGGNITYAGRVLQKRLEEKGVDPINVVVTTLDADNRPHSNYLAALTYTFSQVPDPKTVSFQPIPMFTNNIWDAPAPMRVIATGNSFWMIVQSLRPHMLRNFSAHAQSMAALIDTDFWSVRTIVEDGHQFWRTYFRYDGRHEVYPIYLPIYQDAVLAEGYRRTLKAQFIQIRRWAWGASDIAYVWTKAFATKNKVPKLDASLKFLRLLEGHISWATAPLILMFSSFIPILFNPENIAANQLPNVSSSIMRTAMIGILITMYLSLKALPPKPARYKRRRTLWMLLQWVYLPVTTIVYSAMAAIYSQTRLFLGKYLDKFDVTEKAVKK